jgi:hypothetical protein
MDADSSGSTSASPSFIEDAGHLRTVTQDDAIALVGKGVADAVGVRPPSDRFLQ